MSIKRILLSGVALASCAAALAIPAPANAEPICVTPDGPCVTGVEENVEYMYEYVTYTIAHPEEPCTVPLLAGPICVTGH